MTPKEQFIEAANIMCGYSREDLAMLTKKDLLQALAIFVGFLFHQPVSWLWHGEHSPAGYGHGLPFVYLMWFIVLLILYLPCKSYMAFKSRHRDWGWLSYL